MADTQRSDVVEKGDLVKINYTIKVLEEGGKEVVYDTTLEEVAKQAGIYREDRRYGPVWVIAGVGKLIDALDKAIVGSRVGEKKVVIAKPEEAFGVYDKSKVVVVSRKRLREYLGGNKPIRVGMEVEINGNVGKVTKVTDRFVYIDFNHPLAGKTLKIEFEVLEKAETDVEKAKAIVLRYFDEAEVSEEGGVLVIKLPPIAVIRRDLESILQSILSNIYDYTAAKGVRIVIEVDFRREEEEQAPGGGESSGGEEG